MATNVGIAPPDYSTTVGQFRALIGDTDFVELDPPVSGQGEYDWYGDDAITGLLSVYGDNPKRAAAQALRTIASSQALLLKKWSADDLSVDGAAIAEALRKLAKDLDEQANTSDSAVDIFKIAYFPTHGEVQAELAALTPYRRYGIVDLGGYREGC